MFINLVKKRLFLILFAFLAVHCFAQDKAIPEERKIQLNKIMGLIKNNKVSELADLVVYPLRRPNPVLDIKTKQEFITYYPTLFDAVYKAELIRTTFDKTNTIDRYEEFGILDGDMWLNGSGKIIAINYHSPSELALVEKLKKETEAIIHPDVKPWKKNIVVCQNNKFMIRIDMLTNYGLRYVCWNKPKTLRDQPDLILENGVQEFQGTGGGVSYSFKNKDWTYELIRVDLAESEKDLGWFLRVYQNGQQKANFRCTETK